MSAPGALASRLKDLVGRSGTVGAVGLDYRALGEEESDRGACDVVLLLTAHAEFEPRRLVAEARLLVDTRNATGALGELPHVVRL
jgi:UDP-N-acetyl-D-mannosaminuronate dehydrogenase